MLRRALGRGFCAAALAGMALASAFTMALVGGAPEAAAHVGNSHAGTTHTDSFSIYRRGHQLDNPRIVSRPASGDTYWPGETVTVLVPWGWANQASISVNSVGTVHLVLSVGNTTRTLTGKWEDRERRYGLGNTSFRRLYFDYVVRKGDRDTDGVSLAENALSSPGRSESGIRGTSGSSFRQFELQKLLHGFTAQAGHKVDTPAPSFSGVSGPTVTLYTGGSVNYRLPQIANADAAHDVSYSVTPALPTGLALNTSTAAITGSHSSASARGNYTLRATDGFGRTADLAFTLAVSTDVGIESISITSNPGADETYGKNGTFGTDDNITVRVDFTNRLGTVITGNLHLDIRIGANTRRASNPTFNSADSNLWDKLDFSYAVQESDWDGDGISFPANPMGGGKTGSLRFHTSGLGGGDNRVNRNFGAIPNDSGHKVRGRQTTPTFGSTASPAYSWVRSNAVSQQLPAATQGDGGVTYSVKEALPDGLAFAAATRTLSGAPTTAQAAANYTLVATDGDGDKAELRFSIEVQGLSFSISSPSVTEGAAGETAALDYEVSLNRAPGRQVTVEYAAAADPGTASSGSDYTAFAGDTLTFASAETSKTVTVTATGDALDEPNETIRIALSNPSGATLGSASTGVGTITDDDPTPVLSLSLSEPDGGRAGAIAESGAGNATTVTARLRGGTSGEAITVTVAATSVYAALAADGGFALSAARTLTIAAGSTASAGVVTITAVDDAIDSTDKSATVSGRVAGGHGLVLAPSSLTLSITDDDAQPTSALVLTPASISETGGVATVTATLSNPSAAAVTLTVAAAPGTGAAVGDYTLSSANTLTIAAGQTTSAGTVTVTANPNAVDSADKGVTISATASGSPGAADPPDATLAIRDDDGAPTVSLVLSSSSVSENGGAATVTAALSGTSSQAVTVTVSAAAVSSSGAAVGDYTLTGTTLTIAANATASAGTVTVTANDNAVDSPDKRVTVTGAATGGNGVADPASLTLTLADDEATPTARLALSQASIAEAGGVSSVTATLSGASSAAVTVTVSAAPGTNAAADDYTLSSANTLTIAAGNTASVGAVTVTAEPDTADSADKRVTISGQAAGGNGIADPAAATLTIVDDDALPTVTLALSSATIVESGAGNVATVTAALSHPSGEAVEVAVSVSPTPPAAASDFGLSANRTLTIAAGDMASVGVVTVTAVDNAVEAPDKRLRVSGEAVGGRGVADPADVTLTIADEDAMLTATLALSASSIAENGGVSAVSATLDQASRTAVTVTVTPVSGVYTVGSDSTIVIAAGQTSNAGDTATITAVNDTVHQGAAGRSTTVTGAAVTDLGAVSVTGATLTLTDDEALPTVTLALSPTSISEGGGVATVTARLSGASSAPATVTVAAAPGTGAVAADYTLSANKALTIAAGATASAGVVTITAVNNDVAAADKTVTVTGAAAGGHGLANPASVTLTITDNESGTPTGDDRRWGQSHNYDVTTASLLGKTAPQTIAVDAPSTEDGSRRQVWACAHRTVRQRSPGPAPTEGAVCRQATGAGWSRMIRLTQAMIDNDGVVVLVTDTIRGGQGGNLTNFFYAEWVPIVALPRATLALSSSWIAENGGVATVTATLDKAALSAATVTVAAAPGSGATAGDFSLSGAATLTFATGATVSSGAVTVTAVDDMTRAPDKSVTVSGTVNGDVKAPRAVTLTIADDDATRTATLSLSASSIAENGGVSAVSATLDRASRTAVTVTVTPVAGVYTVGSDSTIVIAAGQTSNAGDTATITAVNDTVHQGAAGRSTTVTGAAVTDLGAVGVTGATLTLTDDEALPTVTLALSSASISEGGGVTTVTATLSGKSGAAATVTVAAAPGTGAAAADYALSANDTLTIAAGATVSAGVVTITAVNNDVAAANKTVTVTGAAAGGHGMANPASVTLTITDNDSLPSTTTWRNPRLGSSNDWDVTTASLLGKTASQPIAFTGTYAAHIVDVWACANRTISQATAFSSDAPGAGSGPRRCTMLTDNTRPSAISLTQAMIDNDGVVILLTYSSGANKVQYVYAEWVPIVALPRATLALSSSWIAENGGAATVTATLDKAALSAATITVAAAPGSGATAGDFSLSSATTLTFATGATASTGAVTVTAVDDTTHTPDKSVTVSGAVNGDVNAPRAVTLTIADDDATLTATLSLSASSIAENGGVSAVSATLDQASRTAVTVTVTPVSGAYTVGPDSTIVIAAGQTANAGDTADITAVNDTVHQGGAGRSITVTGAAVTDLGAVGVTGAELTLTDDETLPTVALALSASSISETGGETTVTATLSGKSSEAVTLTVSASPGSGTDFTQTGTTLTIAAGATVSAGAVTVTASGNDVHSGNKPVTVSAAATGGNDVAAPPSLTLTLTDDETLPTVALSLSPASISENGGVASVTATLSGKSSEAVTVTVGAAAGTGAADADFDLSAAKTLTIAAGATASSGDVTVTANDNDVHSGNKSVTVSGAVTGGNDVAAPSSLTLTLTDDETLPTVALSLSPSSISETGGVASVTAALSGASSEAVTVTVGAAAGAGAVAADFGLSAEKTLTIAAGATASSGDVTITANGNDVDSPDKSVTVSGAVTGGNDVAAPTNVTLTLTDDETLPTLTLALSSSSVSETGGKTTVTATLSGKSSEALTVTVGAAAGTGAVAADFALSAAKTLTIAAGATASAGTVTVTANGNLVDTNDKSVTVSAAVAGGHGVAAPSNVTLTLTDDDTAGVTFNPTAMTLTEEGASKTFTMVLDTEPPGPGFVSVGLYPDVGLALQGDSTFSPMRGLVYTFAVSSWSTPQTVSVNASADADHQDNTLRLRYVVADYGLGDVGRNVAHAQRPVAVTVTVEDDDKPVVTLALSESSISENGGVATVTATLDKAASEGATVTVSASPGSGTDFTQTGTELTIAAGATASAGVVTITASDDDADAPDKEVTVSAAVDGGDGASDPDDVTLTLTDDEAAPGVTLTLSSSSIAENGGETTVSAALSHPSSADTTVTVTAATGFYTVGSDAAIVISAGDTVTAGDTATVEAVDDDVHQGAGGRPTTVTATAANDQGAGNVSGAALTLTDDETLPTVTLALSSSSISETGGVASVTATLSGKSSEAVTVTVGAAAGTGAAAADFDLSAAKTLTIAAGSTASAGTVTVTANGNDVDSPDKSVTVSGAVDGGNNVAAPSNVTLTLTDDETLPTVTLSLSPSSISETGGVSSVTATLSGKSSEAVTVTVAAAAGAGAAAADFDLSAAKTLTIAAGSTASAGDVTITANGNDVDSPDKSVTVSGVVDGGNNVAAPSNVTLTLTDDETLPTVTLALSSSSISETGGETTVTATLSGKSSEAVTVTVGAAAGTGAAAADFDLSAANTLTIAAGSTASAGAVTITANGNDVDSPDKSVTVSGAVDGGNNVAAPSDVTLTLTDDETLPTLALALSSSSISETGGVATVTATLSGASSEAVTVTVAAVAGTGAVAADFDLSAANTLTIAAGSTTSAGAVTVTANGNNVHSPDKSVTVSGAVDGGNNVLAPSSLTLTLTDDDVAALSLLLSDPISGQPDTIKELATAPGSERMTTVTARLSVPASAAVTITVSATKGTNAAADDFTLSAAKTLTIAAGATASTGAVTITAVDDRIDSIVDDTVAGKKVVVAGVASSTLLLADPADVELLIWEDDRAALVTAPAFPRCRRAPCPVWLSVAEGASESFTVKLNSEPTTNIVVAVKSSDSAEGQVSSGAGAAAASTRLTFTATNWETAQTVTLHGVVDDAVDGDGDYTLRLFPDSPDEATDAYHVIGGASVRPQTVRTTDVDTAGLAVSESTLTVTEGGAEQTFTVKLTSKPAAAVTVTATSADGDEVRLARNAGDADARAFAASKELVFDADDWSDAQTLRVTAVDDDRDDPASLSVAITLDAASGGDSHYDGLDDETVDVTKNDDDPTPTVTLARSPSAISETGGTTTVTATLSGKSDDAVTVTVAAAPGTGAAAADFDLSTAKTLTIAAGATASVGVVTVTANGNDVDSPDKQVTISGAVAGGHGLLSNPSNVTLTLTDDETLPTVSLALSSSSISETGGAATVTATLSGASSEAVTVTVAAVAGTGAVAADFGLSAAKTLTIAAGGTTSAGTVTVTANGNDVHSGNKSVTVSATAVGGNGVAAPSNVTLTLADDEALPTVTLALSSSSISETGGVSSVTATLSGKSSEAVTVTVAAAAGTGATAADFDLSAAKTLTIAAGGTTSSGAVTVTANGNDVHSGDKSVTVSGVAVGGNGVAAPSNVTLTLTDDETLPTVTLALSSTSIPETGGVSSVTATLSGKSSAAVTVTVGAAAGTGAVAADFDLSAAKTLTIAAGGTTSAGVVTITANGNTVDSPNKSVTVSGMVAGGNNVAAPSNVTLTLTDDDALPTATLLLSAAAIDESGASNVTTVTARLNHGSSDPVTVTVSLSPVSSTGAVAGDYTLSSTATLTIAAGASASAGLVTVTAVDNDVDAPNRQVTVSGTADGGRGVADPAGKTLTIRDDDGAPGVTLSLSVTSIFENSQSSAVSATLSHPSSAATTVTVTPVAGAFTAPSGTGRQIVFTAGNTTSSHTVPITSVDNDVDEPDRMATVTATVANDQGAGSVTNATLTIRDNETTPTVTLSVNPTSISESGATATVSATLSGKSSQPTTVTVTAQANVFTAPSGAAGRIVIAAGQTANASDTVVVTAVDNDVDAADNPVTVAATADNGHGVGTVAGASLTFTDDDVAGLAVSPTTTTSSRLRTTEAGGTDTFTVALESEPTGNVELDLASSDTTEGAVSPSSLTFTSTNWNTAQTVTLTGQDDAVADGNQDYQATLTVDQANTADAVYDALPAVTVYAANVDDEFGLDVGAVTGQATEAGGQATFPVKLLTQPAQAVTVTVSSRDSGEGRVSPSSLIFGTANWGVNQTVTVTGLNDAIDDGTVTWQVRLDPASGDSNYNALANVDVSVTTTDDDGPPAVTLALSPSSIDESGTASTAAVRATLSRPSSAATTVTVTAVSGFYTVASGAGATIVIAANATTSTDTASITAVDNTTDEPDRTPTVTATVANDRASADSTTMAVTGGALTIRDDDAAPNATLSLNPATVAENGGTSAVSATLSHRSSAATTVTVTAVSGFYTVGSDATIVIPAGDTTAASDTAAITAVNNDIDEPNRTATVTATLGNSQGTGGVTGATLTLTDDETLPTATLVLSSASISEAGGVSTVTARLSGRSSAAVTLTVSAAAGTGAVSGDFSQTGTTLTIAAGSTASAGRVTVRANDNMAATGSKQVTVSATAAGGNGVANPSNAALTLTDDDTPQVTLALSSSSIGENGGAATVTATLDRISAVAVTVTVAAAPVSPAVATDFTLSSANTLTFAANATTSSGVVTITAANNDTDAPNKQVTVSGTSSDSLNLTNDPPSVRLTITDDDAAPGATLSLSDASIAENGGTSAVSAALSHPSSAATTVTVTAVLGSFTVPSGAAGYVVIAAGDTTAASDTVTITAVNNDVDEPNRMATVTAALANDQGAGSVIAVTLTLEDDDATPTAALSVNPGSIPENGGTAAVSATLSGRSSQPTTVTVTAQANVFTVAPGAGGTIVVPAGATTSSDTATVTAVNNDVDAADNVVTVAGTAANGHGVTAAATGASLTITDDDVAAIALSAGATTADRVRTSEDGSADTVDVTLATRPTGNVVIDVASTNTAQGTVSPPQLTFTASNWNTAQTVTLTGVDDPPPGSADGSQTYEATLTVNQANTVDANYDALPVVTIYAINLDDEYGLNISNVTGQASEGGGAATFTVALNTRPSAAVTVSVTSRDASEGRVAPASLVFGTGNWSRAQRVTVTGVDDAIDDGDITWRVRLNPASGDPDYNGLASENVQVTTRDDDDAPTVTLVLSQDVIAENGGVTTVTATLSHPSSAATTVTVGTTAVAPAVAGDFAQTGTTLTIAANATTSTGVVTVTAVNDDIDAENKQVRVAAPTVANDRASADSTAMAVTAATLTLEDDDEKGLAFVPAEFLAVTAGGSTSYTVALTSEPTGPVTVTVPQGGDAAPSPSSLTFTAADWGTAQAVTVTAAPDDADDYADAATPLIHNAAGGGYAGVTVTVSVAVMGDTVVAVIPGADNDYGIEGRRVTVRAEAGVPKGIELDLKGLGAGEDLTLTLTPNVAPDVIARAAVDEFSFGPEGSRTVVDIAVSSAPASEVRVCLPVQDELRAAARGRRDAAQGRPLLLLHYDGSAWTGTEGESGTGGAICARVAAFSPFAVGYKDTRPAFPAFQKEFVWTVDEAIEPVMLPVATGGDGTPIYALLPSDDLPPGIVRNGHRLSGTPTEPLEPPRTYRWTATDLDGEGQRAEVTFTIEVRPALEQARARLKAINESILPELSRAQWGSVVEAVTGRLAGPGANGGLMASVAEALKAQEGAQDGDGLSWREVVNGRTFQLGLDESGADAGGSGGGVAVWGAGEGRALSLDKEALEWSGDAYSVLVGADGRLTRALRAGVAASWFESLIKYTDRSEDAAITGAHESRMQAIHPYLGWSGDDGSRLWGVLGYGVGEIEITDVEVLERFGVQTSDSELLAAAAGGAVRVVSEGALTVDVKGALEATRYAVEDNGVAIAAVSVETLRLRLSVEGSRAYVLEGGGLLVPSLEVGVRWDGGDGETGDGIEIGGGVSWSSGGWSAEVHGRGLAAHESGLGEWGAGGALRLDTGGDGRGLSLSLLPSWGAVESGLSRLWQEGVTVRAPGAAPAAARLEAVLGYGFGVLGGSGVATPYVGFGLEEGDARRYRVGTRLGLGDSLDLSLEAERKEGDAAPDHGAKLDIHMRR